jgi:hypothetical protein
MIQKIVSGGQTGADRAGLIVAKKYGLKTGGYIPKGFKTELGSEPQLAKDYGLIEFGTTYPQRTLANVQQADATVIFYFGKLERGSALTVKYCEQRGKPHLPVSLDNYCENTIGFLAQNVLRLIQDNKVSILNVAGNRESVAPGIEEIVVELLSKVMELEKRDEIS